MYEDLQTNKKSLSPTRICNLYAKIVQQKKAGDSLDKHHAKVWSESLKLDDEQNAGVTRIRTQLDSMTTPCKYKDVVSKMSDAIQHYRSQSSCEKSYASTAGY